MTDIALREATLDDAELLLTWRNDPATRRNSFTSDVIDFAQHRKWLRQKLAARDQTRIWILMADGSPAGQIRYDLKDDVAEISFSIDVRYRGRGLGTELLRLTAPKACRELGASAVRGFVNWTNTPSIRAFERAGFAREGDDPVVFVRNCGSFD